MEKIKVALCDDMRYLCQYFEILINREEDMEVVGISDNAEECLKLSEEKKPDEQAKLFSDTVDELMSQMNESIDFLKQI